MRYPDGKVVRALNGVFKTRLTEMLGIRLPVIQGGLAHLADARLAAAVSEAGAFGQVTAANYGSPRELRDELRRVRELTNRPVGLNLPIGHWPWEGHLAAALEEGVACAVTVSGGNPEAAFRMTEAARGPAGPVRRIALVAGVRQAQKAEALGADAVVAVGQEAGGHIGRDDTGTLVLVRAVVKAVGIPVIAAGGICDGHGLVAALALGAEGVQMGTRFVATAESRAHPAYKDALLKAPVTGTTVIERTIGRPGRVLDNPAARRILDAEQKGATFEELFPLINRAANEKAALEGDMENGFVWAGQVAGLLEDAPPVALLLQRLEAEAAEVLRRLISLCV